MILIKKIIIIIFLILLPAKYLLADTIYVDDGTILTGKVVKKTKNKIIFANSYGTFTIKLKQVKKLHKTTTYKDDIKLMKEQGKKINQAVIEKAKLDYFAGLKLVEKARQEKRKKVEKINLWNFHRLTLYFNYTNTFVSANSEKENIHEIMKHGLGFTISYDYGFEKYLNKRLMFVPGIRVDSSLMIFTNDYSTFKRKVIGLTISTGPMWILPSIKNKWGYFMITSLPGLFVMGVKDELSIDKFSGVETTFSINSIFGYGYTLGRISLQALFQYNFIYDAKVSFHSLGFSVGVSYIFF